MDRADDQLHVHRYTALCRCSCTFVQLCVYGSGVQLYIALWRPVGPRARGVRRLYTRLYGFLTCFRPLSFISFSRWSSPNVRTAAPARLIKGLKMR